MDPCIIISSFFPRTYNYNRLLATVLSNDWHAQGVTKIMFLPVVAKEYDILLLEIVDLPNSDYLPHV